jgi:prevent-host-death family protein
LNAYLDEAGTSGPIVITRNGKPVAVLLAMQDEDEIERIILAYSPKFQRILQTAEQQIQAGQGIPHKEFWRIDRDSHWHYRPRRFYHPSGGAIVDHDRLTCQQIKTSEVLCLTRGDAPTGSIHRIISSSIFWISCRVTTNSEKCLAYLLMKSGITLRVETSAECGVWLWTNGPIGRGKTTGRIARRFWELV